MTQQNIGEKPNEVSGNPQESRYEHPMFHALKVIPEQLDPIVPVESEVGTQNIDALCEWLSKKGFTSDYSLVRIVNNVDISNLFKNYTSKIVEVCTVFFNKSEWERSIVKLFDGVYIGKWTTFYLDRFEDFVYVLIKRNLSLLTEIDRVFRLIAELEIEHNSYQTTDTTISKRDRITENDINQLIFSNQEELQNEIELFLESQKEYRDLNLLWKKGILFTGPPGNGKTAMIRAIQQKYNLETFDAFSLIDVDGFLCMKAAKKFEQILVQKYFPNKLKPVLIYFEDIDRATAKQGDEDIPTIQLHRLLNALDGVDQYDGIISIATTNNPQNLSKALSNRPGRFDSIYSFGNPTKEQVLEFFKKREVSIENEKDISELLVKNKCSFAFLEEFVKNLKLRYRKWSFVEEEANTVCKKILNHREEVEKTFGTKLNIGFE